MARKEDDYKRPNHRDFMDSTELKKDNFTGMRHNSITDSVEIWVLGEKVRTVTNFELQTNRRAIVKALSDEFAIDFEMLL